MVKGNVNASMQQGYHQDVQRIIDEARTSFSIDRIVLYDDRGTELRSSGAGQGSAVRDEPAFRRPCSRASSGAT